MLMYRQLLQPKTVAEAYEMALKLKNSSIFGRRLLDRLREMALAFGY